MALTNPSTNISQVTYQGVDIFGFVDQHPYLLWITAENSLDQWRLVKQKRRYTVMGLFISPLLKKITYYLSQHS